MLRHIASIKIPLFQALDTYFGPRDFNTVTPSNRPFHLLEHPETLWLKAFCSYILSFQHVDSLIWLHDGIWISPQPSTELVHAGNLHATAKIGLGDSPLLLRNRSCSDRYEQALHVFRLGRLPPDDIPTPLPTSAPRPAPPLSEVDARRAFTRMMQSSIPPARPPLSCTEVIVVDD